MIMDHLLVLLDNDIRKALNIEIKNMKIIPLR